MSELGNTTRQEKIDALRWILVVLDQTAQATETTNRRRQEQNLLPVGRDPKTPKRTAALRAILQELAEE